MGHYYILTCENCGYQFDASYGSGFLGFDDDEAMKQSFEQQSAKPHLQSVYNAMKTTMDTSEKAYDERMQSKSHDDSKLLYSLPFVHVDSYLYRCEACYSLFNSKRITISTLKGKYIEDHQYCPFCNQLHATPVDEDKMVSYPEGHTTIVCPKCKHYSMIRSVYGVWD